MKQNNFWKWALILFVLGWSLYEIYPPQGRPLLEQFNEAAANRDTNFNAIVTQARALEAQRPNRSYQNLLEAVGTNDLKKYFPGFRLADNEPRPNRAILNRLQREAAGNIKLGLDLQGGTAFMVRMEVPEETRAPGDTNDVPEIDRSAMVDQAIEVLRRRVDAFGVAEPIIQKAGDNRILVQLPGLSEAEIESARTAISKPAFLEFRLVHPQSDEYIRQSITPPGYDRLNLRKEAAKPGERERVEPYLVKRKAERGLIGKYVRSAYVTRDTVSNAPEINLRFDSEGTRLFADITRENVGRQLAIVLDGELYSAPVIQDAIVNGNARISGGSMTIKEALQISQILQNPLEAPLAIEEQRSVDPSLGKDSIGSGVRASMVAAILTFAFMAFFYFLAGMVANVALLLNVIILLGFMCSIDATLTLPGIAGIALTIGMAVDANVLIFERIREEIAKGKSLRGALAAGYDRAFGTIFDSNITTLITSAILIWQGTGPIKGFGVTLAIGVAVSFFTALMVTRMIFNFMIDRNLIKSLKMMPIIKVPNINFLGGAKFAAIASIVAILIGAGFGIAQGEKILGVDFRGGDGTRFRFAQKVDVDRLRDTLTKLNVGDPQIQYQRSVIDQSETLNIVTAVNTGPQVETALKQQFPDAKFERVGSDNVGPTVGAEIQRSAIISTLLAFFGILAYVAVRYEFGFAVAAVVAVIHDVLVTMGIFFLKGGELSAPMVAAVLTIIGYSINDKIVILDRIREDLKLGVRGSFREIINLALNQTLSRTLITGGSVILATLALYLLGGGIINDFAFTFLVGIIVGTYSSIYIAAPLVLRWYKGEKPGLAQTTIVEQPEAARA